MTIGDGIAVASIAFAICLYRFIELRYSKIGRGHE
jgi:peptidoglycan/LPS O-acetylase OafA/YrhL